MPFDHALPASGFRASRRQLRILCLLMMLPGAGSAQSILLAHEDSVRQTLSTLPAQSASLAAPLAEIVIPPARQREQGLRSVVVPEAAAAKALLLPGTIIADPDASAWVVAPETGRLEVPADGFPALGDSVAKGAALAMLRPVLSSAETGDLRAEQAEAERDMQSTQVQLEQFRLAGQDVQALTMQSATAYSKLRAEHDAAKKRLAELGAVTEQRVKLAAPLEGRISYTHVDPGRVVNPGDVIFEIIRPDRLWVSALNFDLDHQPEERAYLTTTSGERLELERVGMAPALSGQALPVHYRIVDPSPGLLVGQPVTVHAEGMPLDGTLTLPAASVLDDGSGGHYVWVQQDMERFAARPVRVQRLDGNRYRVESGLAPGERVVIAGLTLFERLR